MITRFEIIGMSKIHFIEEWRDINNNIQLTPNVNYIFRLKGEYDGGFPMIRDVMVVLLHDSDKFSKCNYVYGTGMVVAQERSTVFTHKPKKKLYIDVDLSDEYSGMLNDKNFEIKPNEIVEVMYEKEDTSIDDRTNGYIKVNEDLFKETKSYIPKPVKYIVKGKPVSLVYVKNTMLNKDLKIYETDSCEKLPDLTSYDIIVIGNKYRFSVEEIAEHIAIDVQFIVCKSEMM